MMMITIVETISKTEMEKEEDGRIKNVEKYDDTFLEGCISSIEHMLYESGMILGIVIQTAMKDNSVW